MIYRFLECVAALASVFADNIVSSHAQFLPFSSKKACLDSDFLSQEELSDRVILLNGGWDFVHISTPNELKEFNTANVKFNSCTLPNSLENLGVLPLTYEKNLPFSLNGSKLPSGKKENNSYFVFRKNLPIADVTKKYFLSFNGFNGGLGVYLNGEYVGFSALGHAEFDLTGKVKEGDNELVVLLAKYSMASFVAHNGGFSSYGILDEVFVTVRNDLYVVDADFSSELTEDGFVGKVIVDLSKESEDSICKIALAKDGNTVAEYSYPATARIEQEFNGEFSPYLAESPELYDLYVSIEEPLGTGECIWQKVGFGNVAIRDGIAEYNGHPIQIYGVDYNAYLNAEGEPMTVEDYKADFRLLKQYGFNTIVPKVVLPEVAKRIAYLYGLYVIDTPICLPEEIKALKKKANFVAYDTVYSEYLDTRINSIYTRDKGYRNVLAMYFDGANITMPSVGGVSKAISEEGRMFTLIEGTKLGTDVIVKPTVDDFIDEINELSASRPLYMADYAVSYGIGNANVSEFAELVDNTPCAMGGSVGNFIDEVYGDVAKEDNGMFTLGREPYASAYSHRFVARPVKVRLNGEKIELYNNSYFKDTDNISVSVSTVKNGKVKSKTALTVTVPPRESRELDIFLGHVEGDMYVNVECYDKNLGDLLSVEQVNVNSDLLTVEVAEGKLLSVNDRFDVVDVRFDSGSVRFSKVTGTIIGYSIKGKEILNPIACRKGGACYNTKINRPFVRNVLDPKYRTAEFLTESFDYEVKEDRVIVNVIQNVVLGKKVAYTVSDKYEVLGSGVVTVDSTIDPGKKCPATLDCFGKQFRFFPDFEHVTYYGKGEVDNYIDISSHAVMGLFDTTASEMSTSCAYSQECGNRTDVHYVKITDGEDDGIIVCATDSPFQIRVSTLSDDEIVEGYKGKTFVEKTGVYLDVNSVVSGYGSGDGSKPLAKYTLMSGTQTVSMKIMPISKK